MPGEAPQSAEKPLKETALLQHEITGKECRIRLLTDRGDPGALWLIWYGSSSRTLHGHQCCYPRTQ